MGTSFILSLKLDNGLIKGCNRFLGPSMPPESSRAISSDSIASVSSLSKLLKHSTREMGLWSLIDSAFSFFGIDIIRSQAANSAAISLLKY